MLSFGMQLALLASKQKNLTARSQDTSVVIFGETPVPHLTEGPGVTLSLLKADTKSCLIIPTVCPWQQPIPRVQCFHVV